MTTTTDEQIDAAILAALTEAGSGDDLQPWAVIRQRVPGSGGRQSERLIALWHSGRVWLIKIGGQNYVARGDAHDRRAAAADPARTPRCLTD